MASDWDQLLQSIVIGLIFSFLLAKLISLLVSFKEDNLHITRDPSVAESGRPEPPAELSKPADTDSVVAEVGSVRDVSASDDDDDDDWEGVETTELDEMFSAATTFVAATAAEKLKVPTDVQLQLYGLYKIATEGPCSSPQPSALKMTARAKWQAWQRLGAMPPEEAMHKYIEIVTELYPSWISGSSMKNKGGRENAPSSDSRGPMGPVFSSFVYEEESGTELKMDAIHEFAREGEVDKLCKCIDSGVHVNVKDSEGRTPLHWAVDRGHLNVVELLVRRNADVNAKDDEGQTPLHYAVVCELEDVAGYLVKNGADTALKDNDGSSSRDLCELNWPWMQPESKQSS